MRFRRRAEDNAPMKRDMPLLIGWNRSPYVRRVAISLYVYGIDFEQRRITAWNHYEEVRQVNPIEKIPALVIEDGTWLSESAAILDYLDCRVGPERALMPPPSPLRDRTRRIVALATAIMDKGRELTYEVHRRPPELRYEPWAERWDRQVASAIAGLDGLLESPCAAGERQTQADMQRFFAVTAPTVHQMVLSLERRGLLRRTPGHARSLEVLVTPEDLPVLR